MSINGPIGIPCAGTVADPITGLYARYSVHDAPAAGAVVVPAAAGTTELRLLDQYPPAQTAIQIVPVGTSTAVRITRGTGIYLATMNLMFLGEIPPVPPATDPTIVTSQYYFRVAANPAKTVTPAEGIGFTATSTLPINTFNTADLIPQPPAVGQYVEFFIDKTTGQLREEIFPGAPPVLPRTFISTLTIARVGS